MSVLLDTSFVIALKNPRDADHARALARFREMLQGIHGALFSTNVVFAEAVTMARVRMRRFTAAVGVSEFFFSAYDGKPLVRLQHLTPPQLTAAWAEYRRHEDKELSLVDWASVAVARDLELDAIASFDEGFDGIYPRLL